MSVLTFSVLIFSCIGAFNLASSSPPIGGRIVGGKPIPIEEVPYQISLSEKGSHFCGGSIVSPFQIITAAHCLSGSNVEDLTIRAGSSQVSEGGQVVQVSKAIQHPKFNGFDYDIAVLELASNLTFGSAVAAIDLPTSDHTWPANTEVFVTGWGLTSETDNETPDNLQGVVVEIVDQETCAKSYFGEITENMICAGVSGGGKDACSMDSGGPLEVDGFLLGVVSFGTGCGRAEYPGVYASVPALREWIRENSGL